MIIQLVGLVSSLQNCQFFGFFAVFGYEILLVEIEENIKTPNILAILFGKFHAGMETLPPEFFLAPA